PLGQLVGHGRTSCSTRHHDTLETEFNDVRHGLSRAWCLLAEREFVVPSSIDCPQVVGHLLADLPNPFAALLEVWSTGYAFADIYNDAIHLIAAEGPPR
ncbi:hypothetical protein AB0L82_42870, partial [Nocardia sp. NPDC052001]|uniref:hypothetical protein n=1 Tax=Nocardia sp. NPDC052001 TaxID=3154853 RepID=UPI0034168CCA